MHPYSNYKKSIFLILNFIFIFSTSGYALNTVSRYNFHLLLILPIIYFFLIMIIKGKGIKFSFLVYLLSYICLFVWTSIPILIYSESISYNMKFLIVILFSIIMLQLYDFQTFRKCFTKAMVFISVISLIGYIYVVYINTTPPFPIVTNITGVQYYNMLFFFELVGAAGGRNLGCFWEPGVYGSFLLLAMMFSILDNDEIQIWDLVFLAFGMVTSQSTATYLLAVLIIFLYFLKNCKVFTVKKIILLIFLCGVFIVILFNMQQFFEFFLKIQPRVFSKLINETASSTVRLESPIANLKIFWEYPILGAGLTRAGILYSDVANLSQTSTSTYLMASFGMVGVAFTILQIFGILLYKKWSVISRIIFLIVFLTIINKEPHTFFSATWIITFYFIHELYLVQKTRKKGKTSEYKSLY